MKVYLNDPIAPSAVERLKAHVEIVSNFDHPEELDAIIVRQQYCTADVIRKATRCKVIQQHGVGLDRIDTKAAEECGIPVKNTPGVNSRSVAEYTVAMMLDLSRKVAEIDQKTRKGLLPSFGMPETVGFEMTGKRLGLIGSGHIAHDVAQICRDGFQMDICCHNPHRSDGELRAMGFTPMSLQDVFFSCDYVSLHCQLTTESYHMKDYTRDRRFYQVSRRRENVMVCRYASDEEMNSIMDLVIRTFAGEQDIPADMNYLPADKQPYWFCAEEGEKLIGTIAFFKEDDGWHAGRFALEPSYRGQHIGTRLAAYSFSEMFSKGIGEIIMEGRPATVHILTKLGAQVTGQPFPFYTSTCTPMRMKREDFHPL